MRRLIPLCFNSLVLARLLWGADRHRNHRDLGFFSLLGESATALGTYTESWSSNRDFLTIFTAESITVADRSGLISGFSVEGALS